MGDRTYVRVKVLKGHETAFIAILDRIWGATEFASEPEVKEGYVLFEINDADWGLEFEATKAAEEGLTLMGWNMAGKSYSPAVWAGLDGKFFICPCDWDGCDWDGSAPVVKVYWRGMPIVNPVDLQEAHDYLEAVEKIEALFKAKYAELGVVLTD